MTEAELTAVLTRAYNAGFARAKELASASVATFAAESDDSPQFRPSFTKDDVARLSDYFTADEHGRYPHTLHRKFGMSIRDFADTAGMLQGCAGDKWYWAKREKPKTFAAPGPPPHPGWEWHEETNRWRNPANWEHTEEHQTPAANEKNPPPKADSHDAKGVAKSIAADLAGDNPSLKAKIQDVALTAAARAFKLALDFTNSKWSQRLGDVLEAIFDTPSDLGKLGYNPTAAGGQAQAGTHDAIRNATGISGHLAASIASKVLTKALFFFKDKLKGAPAQMADEDDWRAGVADMLCDLFDAVNEVCGLPPVEWDEVYDSLVSEKKIQKFAFDESKEKRDASGKWTTGAGDGKTSSESGDQKVEKDKLVTEADFESPEQFGAMMGRYFAATLGFASEKAAIRTKIANEVAAKLTSSSLNRLSKSVKGIVSYKSNSDLKDGFNDLPGVDPIGSDEVLGGFYHPKSGTIHINGGFGSAYKDELDADQLSAQGIYAHELTHAIDAQPNSRGQLVYVLSSMPAFEEAFREEIADGQLSDYASTEPEEGFAEFGRLLYGSNIPIEVVERHFPKTLAYFRSEGLI